MTNYADMPNVKPPQFSLDGEMERLRVEIRDRDFEIITLRAQIAKMRNCENCVNAGFDGETYTCEKCDETCALPELEAWEMKE